MKNKKSLLIASIFAITALVGCGSNNKSSSYKGESMIAGVGNSSNKNDDKPTFKVKVLMPDGTPANGVKVQWCVEDLCLVPVSVDANGEAAFQGEAKKYDIHLLSVPKGYTYNPNIYSQDVTNPEVTITLSKIEEPKSGDGNKYANANLQGGPFAISEGVYKANITKDNGVTYFAFSPSKPGNYVIESWADQSIANYNEVDPFIGFYCKSLGYIPNLPLVEDDNSGIGENFSLKFEVEPDNFQKLATFNDEGEATIVTDEYGDPLLKVDENGNNISEADFIFGLSGKVAGDYNFKVYYESAYVDTRVKTAKVKVEETLTKFPDNDEDKRIRYLELDGSDKAIYNEADHFYHLNSKDGDLILANISGQLDALVTPISDFPEMGNPYVLANGTKNYKDFVAAYAAVTNDDGVYPLTKELKLFLEELIEAQDYFGEFGFVSTWFLESHPGYVIDKASQFMFACGVYLAPDGIESNPRQLVIEDSSMEAAKVKENDKVYYEFSTKADETVYIYTNDDNARFIYKGKVYDEGKLEIEAKAREVNAFQVTTKNSQKATIYFNIGSKDPTAGAPTIGTNYITVDAIGTVIDFTPSEVGFYEIGTDDPNAMLDFFTGDYYGVNYESKSFVVYYDGTGYIEFLVCLDTFDFSAEPTEVSYYITKQAEN